ncbi:hypothetical protein THAOC_03363, partial [Thalassiosira oceanica]
MAAVAQPSGQAFCKECLDDHLNGSASWVDGKPIEGQTPSKVLDSIIFNAALQGQFEKEDADEYLKRREEMGFDPPTERERDNILGVGKATAKPSVTLSPSQIPTARNWNKNRNSVLAQAPFSREQLAVDLPGRVAWHLHFLAEVPPAVEPLPVALHVRDGPHGLEAQRLLLLVAVRAPERAEHTRVERVHVAGQ